MNFSFLWHDYETWGANPQIDRPAQFAAIRTDETFSIIDDPIMLYAKPPKDILPHPEACLVTGLTPATISDAQAHTEYDFIRQINEQMSTPHTCTAGYNNLRFDDEVTRFTLYRNLLDPYAREWQHGCSRWDLIDVLRMARALRPDGIQWPDHDDGKPSFRLEDLTAANDIEHGDAHDALADVYATIAMARLLKQQQPRLFSYALALRDKRHVAQMLNPDQPEMMVHISGKYDSRRGNMAIIVPLAVHPTIRNQIIVYDVACDPSHLDALEVEELHRRIFSTTEMLEAEGVSRIPLKTVHLNRCPMLAPLSTLTEDKRSQYGIDLSQSQEHRHHILSRPDTIKKLQQALVYQPPTSTGDPDMALYEGFIPDADRQTLHAIHANIPETLIQSWQFSDTRLPELLFRFRARNFPETLTKSEQRQWLAHIRQNLNGSNPNVLSLNQYRDALNTLPSEAHTLVNALEQWGDTLEDTLEKVLHADSTSL
jgi:exodeoxyribonuclease I